ILMPDGDALRTAFVKDGYAMQLAVKKGYNICVISGGNSPTMHKRLENLNIHDFYLGIESKIEILREYMSKNNLKKENVIYMGDDIPDFKCMQEVGIACCPADAVAEIKEISQYISHKDGGRGCVRDIIEQVLRLHGTWMNGDVFSW
ncbi:MAG: HAD-IA family hydrolase, partial [Bacteroidales bacterium]|nr:HAD-IA family hydrolase [Bacteroidales bacterium]